MADVQSTEGWTKTDLGNGWTKITEVCPVFGTGTGDAMRTTPITNTTANAVSGGPSMPIINELKAAGSFVIQATSGAGASLNADLYLDMKDTAGAYQNASGKLAEDLGPSGTKIATYSEAITDGLKVKAVRDAGTAANPITFSIIYYNGGPNQSDVTITNADPS